MSINEQLTGIANDISNLVDQVVVARQVVDNAATSVTTAVSTHTAQPDPHGQYVQELAGAEPVFATVDALGRPQGMRLRGGQVVGGVEAVDIRRHGALESQDIASALTSAFIEAEERKGNARVLCMCHRSTASGALSPRGHLAPAFS